MAKRHSGELLDERISQAKATVEEKFVNFWKEQKKLLEQSPEPLSAMSNFYQAMAFACDGGKRLRAFLVAEGAYLTRGSNLSGKEKEALTETMMAIEMVHAYSLVHDDLPAMDNDVLRRGKPTLHVSFGEATAILVGDALLTKAFELLACLPLEPSKIKEMVQVFAKSSGARGMVAGQVIDMEGEFVAKDLENGSPKNKNDPTKNCLMLQEMQTMQTLKTGELIACAFESGVIIAGGLQKDRIVMRRVGLMFGKLFQIVDDVLDVEGDEKVMGKKTGRDKHKITWYHFMNPAEVKVQIDSIYSEIESITATLPSPKRENIMLFASKLRSRKG